MGLQGKVLSLKLEAAMAARHADFWQRAIDTHGEEKATAFYTHLGLNHLETKGFEWEGLTLSREPKEHEKIAVKGIHQAQQSAKESISTILLNLRQELITDGLEGISNLDPAKYHTLVLQAPPEFRKSLRDRLVTTYRQGRRLVAVELSAGRIPTTAQASSFLYLFSPERKQEDDEFDDLDMLTDLTDARVVNDVQSRIIADAARFALLGLAGVVLVNAVRTQIADGSVSYIDRASTGLANKVINIGRGDEAEDRKDEWGRVEYSALLDANVCGPCAAEDGTEAATEDELTPVPNPDCEGGDWCRCFHVFVQD